MRAVVLRSYGGPDVLTIEEVPDPVPDSEEILVDVAVTALNRADLLQRRGLYPGPVMDHEIPGLEYAGRVSHVGKRVSLWKPGDLVMGLVGGGGYAELVTTHERQVLAVPAPVGLRDAAAIPEVFITAWDALVRQGGLSSGRVALVHAGASGVGTAAIQIARAIGAAVIVTCSAAKVAACRAIGADKVVDYATADFVEEVMEFTRGRGVDVVLDVVGGDYVDRNVNALAIQGRIVQVGVMAGGGPGLNVAKLLPKRATIVGTVLRSRPPEEKIAVTRQFAREVLPLFDRGQLRPVVDSRFPFDRIADAHRAMEANANVGKILVDVS